jgi:hypothetical protein
VSTYPGDETDPAFYDAIALAVYRDEHGGNPAPDDELDGGEPDADDTGSPPLSKDELFRRLFYT